MKQYNAIALILSILLFSAPNSSFATKTTLKESTSNKIDLVHQHLVVQDSAIFKDLHTGERLQQLQCLENLIQADANKDRHLSKQEFVTFVRLQSPAGASSQHVPSFEFFKLDFVSLFYSEACTSCYKRTGDSSCCADAPNNDNDDAPYIDLSVDSQPDFVSTVIFICTSVNNWLGQQTW